MRTLITNAIIVNEGNRTQGALLICDDRIESVIPSGFPLPSADETIDAEGAYLLPGVIDDHVHFREPGLTHKADIEHESRAALVGGVTSVMDMPNVVPQTTTNLLWAERQSLGAKESRVNYAYYIGATNENIHEITSIDTKHVPAIKLFMGSSTGNMLVDKEEALRNIFRQSPTLIMAHCEDTQRINERMAEAKAQWGEDPDVKYHAWIRDAEACYQSSALAARLANEEGAYLHIAHITTERELTLINNSNITAEVCIPHLVFTDADYTTLGTRIKCNPSVKSKQDRDALRKAICDGTICTIGTDHAPHTLAEKAGGACKAVSGMPMVQFSLVSMLDLMNEGIISIEQIVKLMCHNPATLFNIEERGFLRPGYKADIVLVKPKSWTLSASDIQSKCGWSPLEGHTFTHKVTHTFVNGHHLYDNGMLLDDNYRGEALTFNQPKRE